MAELEQNELSPALQENLLQLYQASLDGDPNEQQRQTDDYQSPIFSELKSIDGHFSDKYIHAMGGMKVVCRIQELRTGRRIAMAEMKKAVGASQEEVEQFLREARVTAALEHPNIVPVYDIDLDSKDKPYFTMRYLRDQSLKKVIRELEKANPDYTVKYSLNMLLEIFLKVCDAVAYAHSRGIVHLDIKPDNVMLGEYGEVYICDWGLARQMDDSERRDSEKIKPLYDSILNDHTLTGVVKGTPGYMAPEQVDKKFGSKNERTDIYSLGALLYALLVLKRPYADKSVDETIKATTWGELPEPRDIAIRKVPESLNAICMKAMAVVQNDRYKSVDGLTNDIRSFQGGFATDAEEVSAFKSLMLLLKRNRLLSVMAVLVVLTGIMVGLISGTILEKSEDMAAKKLRYKDVEVEKLHQKVKEQSERLKKFEKLVSKGVVAKWKLNEGFGMSVNGEFQLLRGILHNGTKWVEGFKGKALQFDGVDDYVSFGDLKQQAFSITLRVKLHNDITKESKPMTLLQYGPYDGEDIISFGPVSNYAKDETLTILGKTADITRTYIRDDISNGWHHIAFVWSYSSGHYKIFIDGKEKQVYRGGYGTHTALMELSNFQLGSRFISDNRGNFRGLIDEVTIYNRSLTDREVAELAK